jgi:predicted lipoprotein with Yx(FWY)xxD motif
MATATDKAAGDWTIANRPDGSKMWAYKGKPLYLYVNDKAKGDVVGDGVGGIWHLAKP